MSRKDIAATTSGPAQDNEVLTALSTLADLMTRLLKTTEGIAEKLESGLPADRKKQLEHGPPESRSVIDPLLFENRVQFEQVSKEYFTLDEAATYICTSSKTIQRYVQRRLLTAHRVGRRLVFSKEDLDKFMRGQKCGSAWLERSDRRTNQ